MAARVDVDAWRVYVAGELSRFYDVSGGDTYIWADTPAAARVIARHGGDSELAAYSGPWRNVRAHVTREFRQWVEEQDVTERLTLSEWRARALEDRVEVDRLESAAHTLGQLEDIRRMMAARDALILDAARRGASKVDIARAAGITRQQVHTIVARELDAVENLAPVTPITAAHGAPVDVVPVEWVRMASGELVEVF